MSYGIRYAIPFATLSNVPCLVEIEQEGYAGESQELTPASSPFSIDIEDEEFLYTPTRFSTGTIRIVGNDYLQSLFSIGYQQYRVTFKKGGKVVWCGFIKPEIYTQDYESDLFEFEIECMSAMSTLEYIDYKQGNKDSRVFISLWDLLKKCISESNARYTSVYIPHVYAKSISDYDSGLNVLSEMTVSEQDFFDEEDKPMKLKEVLEEICKLLNWTCVDFKGDLYFVDIDHSGAFYRYDSLLNNKLGEISPGILNVQEIGFSGNGHSLDILPGYNKVTVKTSNYPVGEIFSQTDFKEMKDLATPNDIQDGDNVSHRVFMFPGKWDMRQYTYNKATLKPVDDLSLYKGNGEVANLIGAIPMRYCNYELNKGVPSISNYNYTNVIQVRQRKDSTFSAFGAKDPIIIIKGSTSVYSYGALCISGGFKIISSSESMSPLTKDLNSMTKADFFKFRIRIGGRYYDGSSWIEDESARVRVPCSDEGENSDYRYLKNTKTLSMPYEGLEGYLIPISKPMGGDFEIIFYGTQLSGSFPDGSIPYGFFLKDFSIKYQKEDGEKEDNDNSDRIYENVVNDKYINELDEIEFKISSYNNDGACYSKVMLGDDYLTDNLYSAIENKAIRPEEQLIRRIINRYSAPHIKLTQVIKETGELTPITFLSDTFMVNKKFLITGGSIDYKMEQFECVMAEV